MSTPSDATLRATGVVVSVVNPQTNAYTKVGQLILLAVRKGGQLQLIVLKPDKTPFFGMPVTANVEWIIQNEVYVSLVAGRTRFLLQFANTFEAQLFTMFALSAKLAASPSEPICIIDKKGSPFGDRYEVSYKCYDLNADKIQDPVMSEDRTEISSSDQTPINVIAKNGTQNSVFLVQYPHNTIAIVQSIGSELPQVSKTAPAKTETASEKPKEDVSQQQPPQQQQQQQSSTTTTTSNNSDSISTTATVKPSIATKTAASAAAAAVAAKKGGSSQSVQSTHIQSQNQQQQQQQQHQQQPVKPQYDAQLQSIHSEIETKFNELSQMIATLRRSQSSGGSSAIGGGGLPLSSDVLVSSVQRLLRENQLKDQLIAEKQQLIDLLNERHSDTRERDDLRVQLNELGSKLSSQRQMTRAKTEKQEELNREIEQLQEKLVQVKQESELRLSRLQQQLDEERQKQTEELDQQRKSIEFNAKQAEEDVARVREQFEKALSENKELKAQSSRDISGELAKLKEQMPQLIVKTVKQMVQGVYGMITDKFDDDEEYDGISVSRGIKAALETQASRMLRQIDPQDEEYDEEEDEEDEEDGE